MRIISQDRQTDVNYENNTIKIILTKKGFSIHAFGGIEDDWTLGEYKTEEEALKVMEDLRRFRLLSDNKNSWYEMPQEGEVV